MSYNTIILEKRDSVAKLALNRSEVLNAIDKQMISELVDAVENLKRDPEVRVVVLTGIGKAFSSGGDLAFY